MQLALLLAVALSSQDDPRIEWLREHAVSVRSVDAEDDDFSDLEPLARAIGNARVVQLGEQSHGDGTCFLAKARLIRFLHQEMGFDVLAWESGFFPCALMEETLRGEKPVHEVAADGLFPVWARSAECMPVFEYARSTHKSERPLEMAGFDVQLSGLGGRKLGDAVVDFLDAEELEVEPAAVVDFRTLWDALMTRTPLDGQERERGEAAVHVLAEAVAQLEDSREAAFLHRSLLDFALQQDVLRLLASPETIQEGSNLRDVQMGLNLVWLADEYYAGKKIIVWAASRHIAHDLAQVDTRTSGFDYGEFRTMGDEVHQLLGEEAYTILFDAYAGRAGIAGAPPFDLEPAPAESLTELLHRTGEPYLFLDLRSATDEGGAWLRAPLLARPFGYALMEARWHETADAVFFTDVMAPSTPVE